MSLQEFFSEPFGPYLEEQFLSDKCTSTSSRVLGLQSLMLECRGKPSGLSQVEHVRAADIPPDPVRFRGILRITDSKWLTPEGHKRLQEDIYRRHGRGKRGRSTATAPKLNIVLGQQMRGTLKVRVWIQGYKNMSAAYLSSDLVPNGLRITSGDRNRHYEVLSMDIETYIRSERYLDRYRVLAAMTHISKQDNGATELSKRDIRFWVKGYLAHCAYPESNTKQRLLFRKNDKDLLRVTDASQEAGLLNKHRKLRTVHRAEASAVFAEHAEWIMEEQESRRPDRRIVDLGIWKACIRDFNSQKTKASRQGVRWGEPPGYYTSDDDEDVDMGKEEEDLDPVLPNDSPEILPEAPTRKRRHAPSPPRLNLARPTKHVPRRQPQGPIYDSDFSPPSSPSYSSCSSPEPPPSPTLLDDIPKWGFTQPRISSSLTWSCPDAQCNYLLDMGKEAPGIFGPGGRLDLHKLSEKFESMVFQHWKWHLEEKGLEWADTDRARGCMFKRIPSVQR
ncbi:hypothetical protein OE88DRAFT_1665753 [Heliocybe sulcata]|uniref:Uncharacterized protein n=1 Tax=Heliocybe sulcata TaxID=5364 RepID=A0A5C3MRA8_9AGAM|nr:hypothetical protein OE88DRAFT_1665753 [Heliocybe sulcata]